MATVLALLLGARVTSPLQRVAVAPGDERALVGFYEREANPLGAYRWAKPDSALFLYGLDGRPAIVTLRLNAARPAGSPDPTLSLRADGRTLGSFDVSTAWRRYTLLAPTDTTGDTALTFGGDTFRPAGDERDLVVALGGAEARPADVGGLPVERTVFLLTLPLIGWLLTRALACRAASSEQRAATTDRRQADVLRARSPLAVGLALALVVGWAAARPALAGYWLPTFGWPWWPFVPLALLLVGRAPLEKLLPGGPRPVPRTLGRPPLSQGVAEAGEQILRWEVAALLGITLMALGLRLYALDTLPLGLWRDEARHGLVALEIWRDQGYRPVYVVQGADLPALLFYLVAPVMGLLGPGVASVRLVSALAGALVPLALWWAARPLVGARAAVLAAALVAWASWALSLSRWGFPATLDQVLTLAAIGFGLRGIDDGRATTGSRGGTAEPTSQVVGARWPVVRLCLAGVLAGLAAYAYHTGRLAPVTVAALVTLRLGWNRAAWRRATPGLVAAAVVGLVILTPLLRFIAEDFQGYNRRTGAVAFYNDEDAGVHAPLLLLLRNGERYLLMWHVVGDQNGRHHAPGAPMVDPVTGGLLLVGVGLALLRRGGPGTMLLAWLALGLVPGMLSTGAPHAMRALPALAPAAVLAAWGLAWLTQGRGARTTDRRPPTTDYRPRSFVIGLSSVVLLTSLAYNTWLYFGQMPRDPRVQEAFDVPETAMGRVVRAHATADDPALRAVRVFLPAGARRSDVVRFLTSGAEVGFFDVGEGLSAPPGEQALLILPAGASPEMRATGLAALGPGARELAPPRYPAGAPVVLALGVGDDAERLLRAALAGE
jgi:4-amino-4-deoxy-L-arabinose transferase-like glycosyltransferase